MNGYRSNIVWATLTVAGMLTWLCAWTAGLCVDLGNWPMYHKLFGAGFVLTSLCAIRWMRLMAKEQRAARSFFDVLSNLEPRVLAGELTDADLPAMKRGHPLYPAAQRMKLAFAENSRRAQEAEHTRTALEVRSQRMRNEVEQIKAILDSLTEPVVAVDPFDTVILMNPSARTLLAASSEPCEGQKLERVISDGKLLELLADIRRRKTPTQRFGEMELAGEQGGVRAFGITANTLHAGGPGDSKSYGAVAVLRDTSGQKAAQKRNAEFVSAVSHEMKTPLSGIKAYVELLADGDAEDEATRDEFLEVINSQTDRLQRLIDNLLNLARIEAGVVSVSKQARSLNELLEEALHVVQPSAEAKQLQLLNDLSPMYLSVLADRDMLLQAAINLLSNAIKYTPDGGTVVLRSRMKDNEVEFEVEDTGVGLSEEDRAKVFEKFYRVKKDRKMAQGTGLGLPLAKHIVEDVHGGRLTVDSQLEKGSTFRITLPCAGMLTASLASVE